MFEYLFGVKQKSSSGCRKFPHARNSELNRTSPSRVLGLGFAVEYDSILPQGCVECIVLLAMSCESQLRPVVLAPRIRQPSHPNLPLSGLTLKVCPVETHANMRFLFRDRAGQARATKGQRPGLNPFGVMSLYTRDQYWSRGEHVPVPGLMRMLRFPWLWACGEAGCRTGRPFVIELW